MSLLLEANRMLNVKADKETRDLIYDGVKNRQRSLFVITSDKPHKQVAKLYFVLKERYNRRKSVSQQVLWCYGENLVFPSCKINTSKQLESLGKYQCFNPEKGPPFSLFRKFTPITSCRYQDSERILGNRFCMCVLQDVEALTPDLLAKIIETVDVGGLVILLIPCSANVGEERFPTSGAVDERVLGSTISSYIVMDDKLKLFPISSQLQPEGLHQEFARLMIN